MQDSKPFCRFCLLSQYYTVFQVTHSPCSSALFRPHSSQSLHLRFGSAAPCPTLKSNVTISVPRTRYRRLARPYLIGFSYYMIISLQKLAEKIFFRSLVEISYADFAARTPLLVYHRSVNKSALYMPSANIFLKLSLTAATSSW